MEILSLTFLPPFTQKLPLSSTAEATAEGLPPVLGSSVQERHGYTRWRESGEWPLGWFGAGAPVLQGKTELGLVSLEKRRLGGDHINTYKYLKIRCKNQLSLATFSGVHWCNNRQWPQTKTLSLQWFPYWLRHSCSSILWQSYSMDLCKSWRNLQFCWPKAIF